jgi:hypothetical protein
MREEGILIQFTEDPIELHGTRRLYLSGIITCLATT